MSYINGKITPPVSIRDVQQLLGLSECDLGSLCVNQSINMWAKYKPVRWTNPDTRAALNQAGTMWNPLAADNIAWWKTNGTYGLTYKSVSIPTGILGMQNALNSLLSYFDGNLNGWEYEKPRGKYSNVNEYYRILDFLGYNPTAARPVRGGSTYDVYAKSDIESEYEARVEYIETADSDISTRDYIKPDDLTNVTLHRGIAIYRQVGTGSSRHYEAIAWCTGTSWIGGGIFNSEQFTPGEIFCETLLAQCTYYIIPVYFTTELTQPGPNKSLQVTRSGHKVITMPYTNLIGFMAIQTVREVVLSNKIISSNYTYQSNVSIKNTGGATASAVYVAAIVNEEFSGSFDEGKFIPSSYKTGNIALPAQTTTLVTSFNVTNGMTSNHIWSVYFSWGSEKHNIGLIQPATPTSNV